MKTVIISFVYPKFNSYKVVGLNDFTAGAGGNLHNKP
jgi:hypothetical protein